MDEIARPGVNLTDDTTICERVIHSLDASGDSPPPRVRAIAGYGGMTGFSKALTRSLAAAAVVLGAPSGSGAVDLLDHGPVLAVGYAEKSGQDMAFPSLGWRWRFSFCESLDAVTEKLGTRVTWWVEPMAAAVLGDESSGEFQVVPGVRFESVSPWFAGLSPYLEGGIGLMYTGLDDLGLGSNILFSDNVGLGFALADSGWSLGYRYRHSSHAGLWAESNSGLDVHYLTVRYDLPAPQRNRDPAQSETVSTTSRP